MLLVRCVLCLVFLVCCVKATCFQYRIPNPTVTAYKPRGLSLSIPDQDGIKLVIFYVNINKLVGDVGADYTQYVLETVDDKWTFDNSIIKLKRGDVVHFKIFVQKHTRGYLLRGTPYVITETVKRPKTQPEQAHVIYEDCTEYEYTSSDTTSATTSEPPTNFVSTELPTTTSRFECPEGFNTVLKVLSETQKELAEAKDDLQILRELASTQPLYLRLSGLIAAAGDPKDVVEFVLFENLNTRQTIKSATRNGTTITFELFSFDQKLDILRRAKKYLQNSKNILITA